MLAMSGADLNAKNKNDETPSGKILLSFKTFLLLIIPNLGKIQHTNFHVRIKTIQFQINFGILCGYFSSSKTFCLQQLRSPSKVLIVDKICRGNKMNILESILKPVTLRNLQVYFI